MYVTQMKIFKESEGLLSLEIRVRYFRYWTHLGDLSGLYRCTGTRYARACRQELRQSTFRSPVRPIHTRTVPTRAVQQMSV